MQATASSAESFSGISAQAQPSFNGNESTVLTIRNPRTRELVGICVKSTRRVWAPAAYGDLAGAFYHLRTLLEHHMKTTRPYPLPDFEKLAHNINQLFLKDRGGVSMQFFNDLGMLIEQTWKDRNYDEGVFPEIATQALAQVDAVKEISPRDIIHCLQTDGEVPRQRKDQFSDLPLTVFHKPRFRIDVYFWLDGTTTVHQHSFCGAFQVLAGSSIHSQYGFERDQAINPQFSTGEVLFKSVELLKERDIRPILPGRQFIHSLFHLDRPSVTITVRTHECLSALPQFDYLKPYLAVDPFYEDEVLKRKVQSILLLLRMKHPDAYSLLTEMVLSSDFYTTYWVLSAVFQHLMEVTWDKAMHANGSNDELQLLPEERKHFYELFKQARRKHGTLVNLIPAVLGELQRQRVLVDLRRDVVTKEHRLFLALLLNVPLRQLIIDLVKQRLPGKSPIDVICQWVQELARVQRSRVPEQTVVGIADFNDSNMYLLHLLLSGYSFAEIEGEYDRGKLGKGAPGTKAELESIYRSFQKSVLIKSLLSNSTATINQRESPHLSE